jgi:hypothetical protein
MTTLLEDLQALLNPLAAGGAHPGLNEAQPPVYPYITWQRIVSVPNVALLGASALQNTRVQVDVYSNRLAEADTVAKAVAAALAASSVVNVPVSAQDLVDAETRAFRVSRDYSVWANN